MTLRERPRRAGDRRTILISGMHSGPNPSPGLGIARSIRAVHPDVRLIGVDYAASSSGLHSPLIDGVVQFPPWREVHVGTWADQIGRLLDDGDTWFVPTLDLELRALAEVMGSHDRVLAPDVDTLELVVKPPAALADMLGLGVPAWSADRRRDAIDAFLRAAPHGAWVKGDDYEAFRVRTVDETLAAAALVEARWGPGWHLEAHVPGQECGIAFCARHGQLLDAVFMSKLLLTPDGKTWSGEVTELSTGLRDRLATVVGSSGWTGGGEVELIRSWDGAITLMELNPRLPAWVHGASVCGANLPIALVDGEVGARDTTSGSSLGAFTRVVEEIAARLDVGLDPYRWTPPGARDASTKHPSGIDVLSRRRRAPHGLIRPAKTAGTRSNGTGAPNGSKARPVIPAPADTATSPLVTDVTAVRLLELLGPPGAAATPHRAVVPALFAARVGALRAGLACLGDVVVAHSIKTCPDPAILREASRLGLVAEAITLDEQAVAADHGLPAAAAVLNGPAKWWPATDRVACWAFFADSLAELDHLHARLDDGFALNAEVVGLRVRPSGVPSRFGVPLETGVDLEQAARALSRLCTRLGARWGLHFHLAESSVGNACWRREAVTALRRGCLLAEPLGTRPAVLDLGGGWHPDDLLEVPARLAQVLADGAGHEPSDPAAATVVLEPGKLLAEPVAAVVSRVVLGVGPDDVVVDAALGDIPEARYRRHPVGHFHRGRWRLLPPGTGRLLGRSCMETDVLAADVDVTGLRPGDHIALTGCGAYDLSMAYPFGRGRAAEVGAA